MAMATDLQIVKWNLSAVLLTRLPSNLEEVQEAPRLEKVTGEILDHGYHNSNGPSNVCVVPRPKAP